MATVLVDINQYKDEIAQLVEEETGLKLEIKSDMTLSLISWVKFNANNINLSNDKPLIADIGVFQADIASVEDVNRLMGDNPTAAETSRETFIYNELAGEYHLQ